MQNQKKFTILTISSKLYNIFIGIITEEKQLLYRHGIICPSNKTERVYKGPILTLHHDRLLIMSCHTGFHIGKYRRKSIFSFQKVF